MAENPTESTPRKSVASKAGVCSVCRCCNDNIFEKKHPIDLYGAKATKESILSLLERLVGYKCHIEDGMPSKACRPCYDKIMKFKKFKEIFENSTAQQRSMMRFKRGKSKGDRPSLSILRSRKKEVGRVRQYQCFFWVLVPCLKNERIFVFFDCKTDLTCPINFSVRTGERSSYQ